MKNLILGITLFSFIHSLNAQSTPSNCCSNAQAFSDTIITNVFSNQTAIWYSFVATQNSMEFIAETINTSSPVLTDISIFSGTCSSLSLMETHAYTINSTQIFSSNLTVGSTYFVKLSSTGGNATQLKSSVLKSYSGFGWVYFENQHGKKDSCFFDYTNPIFANSADNDTVWATQWRSCLPTFCVGDTICIFGTASIGINNLDSTFFSHIHGEDLREMSFKNLSEQPTQLNKTIVYPNPFNEQFKLESEQLIKTIHIFDLKGKIILSKMIDDYSKEIALQLNAGMYVLQIQYNDESIETQKLVVE